MYFDIAAQQTIVTRRVPQHTGITRDPLPTGNCKTTGTRSYRIKDMVVRVMKEEGQHDENHQKIHREPPADVGV